MCQIQVKTPINCVQFLIYYTLSAACVNKLRFVVPVRPATEKSRPMACDVVLVADVGYIDLSCLIQSRIFHKNYWDFIFLWFSMFLCELTMMSWCISLNRFIHIHNHNLANRGEVLKGKRYMFQRSANSLQEERNAEYLLEFMHFLRSLFQNCFTFKNTMEFL